MAYGNTVTKNILKGTHRLECGAAFGCFSTGAMLWMLAVYGAEHCTNPTGWALYGITTLGTQMLYISLSTC